MGNTYEQFAEDKRIRNEILSGLTGRPDREITFEDFDRLNLKEYGQGLLTVIKDCHTYPRSNDSKSYVIGLDAEWGSGKTTFLSMLYSSIDKEPYEGSHPILPVYYNAWKGDFWNNAFEPFFDCIWNSVPGWCEALKLFDLAERWKISLTNREEAAVDSAVAREGESAQNIAYHGLKASGLLIASYLSKPLTVGMDSELRKAMEAEMKKVYEEAARKEKKTEDFFPEYAEFRNAVKVLQAFLEDLARDGRKLVIFVDELDRCRPDFAVQTLEIIKHLFDVDRVVFVLALDINQLSNTVKKVYGNEFESVGYLERFFNLMTMLPMGGEINYREILKAVQDEIIVRECAEWAPESGNFEDYYKPYRWNAIMADFAGIAQDFGLSLREYRRVLLNMHILERTVLKPYLSYAMARVMYFYCLVLKYKHPVQFSKAVFKRDAEELVKIMPAESYERRMFPGEVSYRLQIMKEALITGANSEIGSLRFRVCCKNDENEQYDNARLSESWISMGEADINGDRGHYDCYSYVLYRPDCSIFDSIRKLTLMEYIYRKLEMFTLTS